MLLNKRDFYQLSLLKFDPKIWGFKLILWQFMVSQLYQQK